MFMQFTFLKRLIVQMLLMAAGRVFQTEAPEKAKLVLLRSMWGLGSIIYIV